MVEAHLYHQVTNGYERFGKIGLEGGPMRGFFTNVTEYSNFWHILRLYKVIKWNYLTLEIMMKLVKV